MNGNLLLFPWLVAVTEFIVAGVFETRVVLAMGRQPTSRVLGAVVRYVPRPTAKPREEVAVSAVLLALCQLLPLGQEGLLGSTHSPDHIAGAGVILAEIVFGLWLWFGTRASGSVDSDG